MSEKCDACTNEQNAMLDEDDRRLGELQAKLDVAEKRPLLCPDHHDSHVPSVCLQCNINNIQAKLDAAEKALDKIAQHELDRFKISCGYDAYVDEIAKLAIAQINRIGEQE